MTYPLVLAVDPDAGRYLIQLDDRNGRVLDVPAKKYYPETGVRTLLAHGGWEDPSDDIPDAPALLRQYRWAQ